MINKAASCICLLMILFSANLCYAEDNAALQYPLEGSYWVYRGKIKWTPEGAHQKVKSKIIVWTMRIHDVIESPEYKIALITGFPNDVAWYEEGMEPQYPLLVQYKNCIYWKGYTDADGAVNAARGIARESKHDLQCILDFPLTKGKKYDEIDESRTDNMYAWYVEGVKKVRVRTKGYGGPKMSQEFSVIYRTLPDHIIMKFVPSLGITRYIYEHHGTVAFEDLRLVEYGKDKGKMTTPPNKGIDTDAE